MDMHNRQARSGAPKANVSRVAVGPCVTAAFSSSVLRELRYDLLSTRCTIVSGAGSKDQHKDAILAAVQQQAGNSYEQQHSEKLRQILRLPSFRYQTFVQQEPAILGYQTETLAVTLEALTQALHLNHAAVVQLLERKPGILCRPHEPVYALQQLSQLVGRPPEQTSILLSSYPQLLTLSQHELHQRVRQLCTVMYWTQPDMQQPAAAAALTGAAAFLELLAISAHRTAQRLAALSAMLDTPEELCASLVQHRITLLQISPAVLRSRLFILADAAGISCCELLDQLDQQQMQCLSGLLLLSPKRIQQQLDSLTSTVQQLGISHSAEQDCSAASQRMLVRLLLRLGGPTAVAQAAVCMVTLRSIVRICRRWQQELGAVVDDDDLAVLLSASAESFAQAKYLQHLGLEDSMSLKEVLLCPAVDFKERFGQDYLTWLAGCV